MKKVKQSNLVNRHDFIRSTATISAGFTILPSHVIGGLGHKPPSDKLNILGVGVGGRGFSVLKEFESENIIGLCDIDWNYSQRTFDYFPKAKKYWDWRNKELDWDGENMRFTNISDSETIRTVARDNFRMEDGRRFFDKDWTETLNARQFSEELIKHKYREGWTLPNMPA